MCHIGYLGQTIDLVHEAHRKFNPKAQIALVFSLINRALVTMMRSRGMCSASGLSSKFTRLASKLAETRRSRSRVRRFIAVLFQSQEELNSSRTLRATRFRYAAQRRKQLTPRLQKRAVKTCTLACTAMRLRTWPPLSRSTLLLTSPTPLCRGFFCTSRRGYSHFALLRGWERGRA